LPTRRFLSALACFSSSLLTVAVAARADSPAERLRLAELESELARKPDLYLVLDPAAGRLEVRGRGIALISVELRETSVLVFRPLFGRSESPALEAPAIWTVREGPGDTDRETIAPTTLRPYSQEEEMEEPVTGGPEKKPEEIEKEPATYRVGLDNGWQLLLADRPPSFGWIRRFFASVRDGWLRLRGHAPRHPPLVALVVAPEDARRLHHLFRTGRSILVAPTP